MKVPLEEIDLAELSSVLAARFAGKLPVGHLQGRTVFRDALVEHLECSLLEAEELIDTLVVQGFLRPSSDPAQTAAAEIGWEIRPDAG